MIGRKCLCKAKDDDSYAHDVEDEKKDRIEMLVEHSSTCQESEDDKSKQSQTVVEGANDKARYRKNKSLDYTENMRRL